MKRILLIIIMLLTGVLNAQSHSTSLNLEKKVIKNFPYLIKFISDAKKNNLEEMELKLSAEFLRASNQQILTRKVEFPMNNMFCDSVVNDTLKWLFRNAYSVNFEIPIKRLGEQLKALKIDESKKRQTNLTYYIGLVPFERNGKTIKFYFIDFVEIKICDSVAFVSGHAKDISLEIGEKLKIDLDVIKDGWYVIRKIDGVDIIFGFTDEFFKDVTSSLILCLESIQ